MAIAHCWFKSLLFLSWQLSAVFVDDAIYLYRPTICAVCCEGRGILAAHKLILVAASYNVVGSIRLFIGSSFAWHGWYASSSVSHWWFSFPIRPRYFGSTVRGVFRKANAYWRFTHLPDILFLSLPHLLKSGSQVYYFILGNNVILVDGVLLCPCLFFGFLLDHHF